MEPNSQATLRARERDNLARVCVSRRHTASHLSGPPGRRGQESQAGSSGLTAPPLCPQELLVGSFRVPFSLANNPIVKDFRMSEPFPSKNFAFRLERNNLNKTKGDV